MDNKKINPNIVVTYSTISGISKTTLKLNMLLSFIKNNNVLSIKYL